MGENRREKSRRAASCVLFLENMSRRLLAAVTSLLRYHTAAELLTPLRRHREEYAFHR